MARKALTLRLDVEQYAALETVANVEGRPVSDVIREAIDDRIVRARQDAAFQERLRAAIERHRALLDHLADD
jgi:predicted transcriptional regulator